MPQRGSFVSAAEHAVNVEGLGKDYDSSGWTRPSVERARKHAKSLMFRGGESSWWKTPKKELSSLGAGVYLYFELLHYVGIWFAIQTILAIPALYFYNYGNGIPLEQLDPLRLSRPSLGNFHAYSVEELLSHYSVNESNHTIDTSNSFIDDSKSLIISYLDLISTLLSLVFAIHLKNVVKNLLVQFDKRVISADDYSIQVEGLPIDASVEEIQQHFSNLYQLEKEDWCTSSNFIRLQFAKKSRPVPKYPYPQIPAIDLNGSTFRPLSADDNVPRSSSIGSWVWDVVIGQTQGNIMRRAKELHHIHMKLHRARAKVKHLVYRQAKTSQIEKAKSFVAKLQDYLKQCQEQEPTDTGDKYSYSGLNAFVTFKYVESKERCLEDYSSRLGLFNLSQPQPLQFRRKHPLKVSQPPCPSIINWENVGLSRIESLKSKGTVLLLVSLLLGTGFYLLWIARSSFNSYRSQLPDRSLCSIDMPATFAQSYNISQVHWEPTIVPEKANLCLKDQVWMEYSSLGDLNMEYWRSNNTCLTPCTYLPNASRADETCFTPSVESGCLAIRDPLTEANRDPECKAINKAKFGSVVPSLAIEHDAEQGSLVDLVKSIDAIHCCQRYDKSTTMFACYCSSLLADIIETNGILGSLIYLQNNNWECRQYGANYILSQLYLVLQVFMVLIINSILYAVVGLLTRFEQNYTEGMRVLSVTKKVLLTQFLNTAVMLLVLNVREFDDFNRDWYIFVGSSVTLTMICNVISPHLASTIKVLMLHPLLKLYYRSHALTQIQLNKAYRGKKFAISIRYASILNTIAVTWMYSSGMPLLLPIATVAFFISYWYEKYLLLRRYRKPPAFDERLPVFAVDFLVKALFLHAAFSFWMHGNNNLMPSSKLQSIEFKHNGTLSVSWNAFVGEIDSLNIFDKATLKVAFPHFILAIILLQYLIVVNMNHLWAYCKLLMNSVRTDLHELETRFRNAAVHPEEEVVVSNPPYSSVCFRTPNMTGNKDGEEWKMCKSTSGQSFEYYAGCEKVNHGVKKTWELVDEEAVSSFSIEKNPLFREFLDVEKVVVPQQNEQELHAEKAY